MQPPLQLWLGAIALISLLTLPTVKNEYCVFGDAILRQPLKENLFSSVKKAGNPFGGKIKTTFKDAVKIYDLSCDETPANALKSFIVDVGFTTDETCKTSKSEKALEIHFQATMERSEPKQPFAVKDAHIIFPADAKDKSCTDMQLKMKTAVLELKYDKKETVSPTINAWFVNGFNDAADNARKLSESTNDEKQKKLAADIRKMLATSKELPGSSKDAAKQHFVEASRCKSDDCFEKLWKIVSSSKLSVGIPEDEWKISFGKATDGTTLIGALPTARATICFSTTPAKCPGKANTAGAHEAQCLIRIGAKMTAGKTPQVGVEQFDCKFGDALDGYTRAVNRKHTGEQ